MKFDLTPDNRDQPDEVLLEDLRAAAKRHPFGRLTRAAYSEVGRFSPATIAARFGGWGRAVRLAGLESARHFGVTRDDCVADLTRVAARLGLAGVTVAQYQEHGKFSEKPFIRHFGGWLAALEAAGLTVSDSYHPRSTDEALFENLEQVWQGLGRQPTVNDMLPPLSQFSVHVYKRRFGGFRKALEAFVAASQQPADVAAAAKPIERRPVSDEPTESAPPKGARTVGWRLRYLVLRRDRFSCRACGRSPASETGVVLEVDHVVPWSRGGTSVEANLQTLCDRCNGGKGAG